MTLVQKSRIWIGLGGLFSCIVIIWMCIAVANRNYGLEGDEIFSYMTATSLENQIEICNFRDQTWYDTEYFENAIRAAGEECFNFKMVVDNQILDVHPPFYYFFLNAVCSFFAGSFSKWYGIGLNIFFILLVHAGLYALLNNYLKNSGVSLVLSTVFCCSYLSLSLVLFVRMYVLLMAFAVWQAWYHLKLYEKLSADSSPSLKSRWKELLVLCLITLGGGLTHYYFLVLQCLISVVFVLGLWQRKRWKSAWWYIGTMAFSGVVYVVLYPTSIRHIFLKYQGRDAVHQFLKESTMFDLAISMFKSFDKALFNGLLVPILIVLGIATLLLLWKRKLEWRLIGKGILLLLPLVIYFWGISKASPYVVVRYVCPVAVLLYAYVIVWAKKLIEKGITDVKWKWLGVCLLCLFLGGTIFYFGQRPLKEPYFKERRELLEEMAQETDYCVYITGDQYNWKTWEDFINYPLFQGLYFIDGQTKAPIMDEKLKEQQSLLIFIDTALNCEEMEDYLEKYLNLTQFDVRYTTNYTWIVLAHS